MKTMHFSDNKICFLIGIYYLNTIIYKNLNQYTLKYLSLTSVHSPLVTKVVEYRSLYCHFIQWHLAWHSDLSDNSKPSYYPILYCCSITSYYYSIAMHCYMDDTSCSLAETYHPSDPSSIHSLPFSSHDN